MLEKIRKEYKPKLPKLLKDIKSIKAVFTKDGVSKNQEELKKYFKNTFGQKIIEFKTSNESSHKQLKVGVVFSGGQASGGHNVISGLFDGLKSLNEDSKLFGYLDGPSGIIDCSIIELTKEKVDAFRNLGGFDLIGSGRTKIETQDQLEKSFVCAKENKFDGMVIIGGDDSNTNAAILAEYFKNNNLDTSVIGVPKTIDGDLKNEFIEISFGFDSACKVYSELIGNISKDAISSKKYYHFIKLMGRSASHVALECAIKTQPNMVLIGEEVYEKKKKLLDITNEIADLIIKRAEKNKNYGVILIPEGLIEFIPEFKLLIENLNKLLAFGSDIEKEVLKMDKNSHKIEFIKTKLSKKDQDCFSTLPEHIQVQLLLDRDPHGNVKVSQIDTEVLFIHLVAKELENRGFKNFNAISHFFGYEGRSGFPSNFDADYCYSLGHVAAALINNKATGYMCSIQNLIKSSDKWLARGIPLISMMNIETRHGKQKPVIKKALVDLNSKPFRHLEKNRDSWAINDLYLNPGPIQFFGETSIINSAPISLTLNNI